jgi:hypothetical protein
MKIRGRKIWASSLEERRILMALGGVPLRVPRGVSPYMLARRIARAAATEHPDVVFVREVLSGRMKRESLPSRQDGSAVIAETASVPATVAA